MPRLSMGDGREEEEREPGAPGFIGGCVLLLYRYIIIANFFPFFSAEFWSGSSCFSFLHCFYC